MNVLDAVVRTLTAYIVGAVCAALLLANIAVPEEGAVGLAGVLAIVFANAYYLLVMFLAKLWPPIGYLLVIPTEPTYGAGADLLWAFLRTLIPSIVGYLLSLIPTSIIVIDPALQTTLVLGIIGSTQSAYYAVLKWAETRWPWLSILLGGRPSAQPRYVPRHRAA